MNYIGQSLLAFIISGLLILAYNQIILKNGVCNLLKPNAGLVIRLAILLLISLIVILGLSNSLTYPSLLAGYMQDFLIALVFVLSYATVNLLITHSQVLERAIDQITAWFIDLFSLIIVKFYSQLVEHFFSKSIQMKTLNLLMTIDVKTRYGELIRREFDGLDKPSQARAMAFYDISGPSLLSENVRDYLIALTNRSIIFQRQQESVSIPEKMFDKFGSQELS